MTLHNAVRKDLFPIQKPEDQVHFPKGEPQEVKQKITVIDRIREYAPYRRTMSPLMYQIVAQGSVSEIQTMGELFLKWLVHLEATGKKSDIATVRSHWNKHLSPFFNEMSPSDLGFPEIYEFHAILGGSGLKERSVMNVLTTLKRMIYLAFKLDIISQLPVFIRLDTSSPTYRDVMNREEYIAFQGAIYDLTDDHHKLGITQAMSLMALRESEALTMRYENIRGDSYVVPDGKSKYPRTLSLPLDVRKHIFADGEKRHGLIFPSSRSKEGEEKPYSSGFCMDLVKQAGRRSGKPNLTQHDLRASCASVMASNGTPMVDLARILGHAAVTTTERYVFALNRSVEVHQKTFLASIGAR